jgi:AbrB family looped-hinge helix DNA binding protein
MTSRVGPKGQVVIPHQLRRELGIEPGVEVEFWLDGDHVAVRPVAARRPLRGRFAGDSLTEQLLRDRVADQEHEDRKDSECA